MNCLKTKQWLGDYVFCQPGVEPKLNFLLILATRDKLPDSLFEDNCRPHNQKLNFTFIKLHPWNQNELMEYLVKIFKLDSSALTPAVQDFCKSLHENSKGNPMLIRHILSLSESLKLIYYNPRNHSWFVNFGMITNKMREFRQVVDEPSSSTNQEISTEPKKIEIISNQEDQWGSLRVVVEEELHLTKILQRRILNLPEKTLAYLQPIAIACSGGNLFFFSLLTLENFSIYLKKTRIVLV